VPAAAVIPAPIAYIKFAAVKKLVVGFQSENGRSGSQGPSTAQKPVSFFLLVAPVGFGWPVTPDRLL